MLSKKIKTRKISLQTSRMKQNQPLCKNSASKALTHKTYFELISKDIILLDIKNQKNIRNYEDATLVIDMDKRCNLISDFLPNFFVLNNHDPLSLISCMTQDSFDLESFTVLLLEYIGVIKSKKEKNMKHLNAMPEFLVLSSYIEMVAKEFPYREKTIKTLKLILESSISETEDKAISLMFNDLLYDKGTSNRACRQYTKYMRFGSSERMSAKKRLLSLLNNKFPDSDCDIVQLSNPLKGNIYVPYCANGMQQLTQKCILYCLQTEILRRKTILRCNEEDEDIFYSLLEGDYSESDVAIMTPSYKILFNSLGKKWSTTITHKNRKEKENYENYNN